MSFHMQTGAGIDNRCLNDAIDEFVRGRSKLLDFNVDLDRASISRVEYPEVLYPHFFVCADRHSAVEAGEAVGAVEFDGSPLGVEAVDPVVAAEGVGEADSHEVEAARVGSVSEVALKGKFFHDGVADE